MRIAKPTLLLDESRCRANIASMAAKARRFEVGFRPHFKTHQSLAIGRWFRDEGVDAITVSSVDMAAYFARDGWRDITIAVPSNPADAARIDELAGGIRLCCLVEDPTAAAALDVALSNGADAMIKVDTGLHRAGIPWDDADALEATARSLRKARRLRLAGVLTHAGHSYRAASQEEIGRIHATTLARMAAAKASCGDTGLAVSIGDTPCSVAATSFAGADEIRPGNFVFFDMQQVALGSCAPGAVAIAAACPVIAIHGARGEIIVHGGAVHLSKDVFRAADGGLAHGQAVFIDGDGSWSEPIEGATLTALSQEHGVVRASAGVLDRLSVGDALGILPAHSCLTANLARGYVTREGAAIDHLAGREWSPT